MSSEPCATAPRRAAELRQLATLFLRLGLTAFGGPAAHIALFEHEVVVRRRWLTREQLLDLLGAANLIPGPNSTEVAIHIGQRRAGFPGLLVAGSCFILPAALLVGLLAWAYVRFGALPQVSGILYAVKPVVLAIIVRALARLIRTAVKNAELAAVAILATVGAFVGLNELLLLLGAGAVTPLLMAPPRRGPPSCTPLFILTLGGPATSTAAAAAIPFGLVPLFLFFLKVGAVLFGSGYVLLAFIRADLVERWHWLTETQLLDAIAVGQITPGPLFTTATFVGYLLGGATGAVVATVGIFLPAFFFVAVSGPLVPLLRRSQLVGRMLDGVNAGSLALMLVVTWHLGFAAVTDVFSGLLAIGAGLLLWRTRLNSVWLILAATAIGGVASALR